MPNLAELHILARKHHQVGDCPKAEQLYKQIIQMDPSNADIWYSLGVICQDQRKVADAAVNFEHVVRLRPSSADAHYSLGSCLSDLGKREEAIVHYKQALKLTPDHAEALTNLAVMLAEHGSIDEAIGLFRQAIHCRPDFAKAHHNLGVALAQQEKMNEAEESLRAALRHKPDYAEACYNLANVQCAQGKRAEGIRVYRQALALKPDYTEAYNNLGLTLLEAGKPSEAAVYLQQAVRLRPDFTEAHNNLGLANAEIGRFAEAEACYHEALRINPRYHDAHNNLANAYKEQGKHEAALASYQIALWLKPDSASAHWNRSLAWLQIGEYEQGWPEYEWRWKRKKATPRPFRQPQWDGAPFSGKTLLVYMEQGLGDMIQFIRYVPLAKERGGKVIVQCPGFLMPLFSSCRGIDRIVPEGSPLPEFDIYVPVMTLPMIFKTTLQSIPSEVPYLFADKSRVDQWRQKLNNYPGFRIGISWQGNPFHQWDRYRSIPLHLFEPLTKLEGVRLFSLQQVHGLEQLQTIKSCFEIIELPSELDSGSAAFMDTAAIIQNLDLIIAPDTALAHLAGALAAPVWLALATIVDWRWMLRRKDSPWYPNTRLFRQVSLGDWEEVLHHIAKELRTVLAQPKRA
jgi:tetratricopeptide (TPR) repeat protein